MKTEEQSWCSGPEEEFPSLSRFLLPLQFLVLCMHPGSFRPLNKIKTNMSAAEEVRGGLPPCNPFTEYAVSVLNNSSSSFIKSDYNVIVRL